MKSNPDDFRNLSEVLVHKWAEIVVLSRYCSGIMHTECGINTAAFNMALPGCTSVKKEVRYLIDAEPAGEWCLCVDVYLQKKGLRVLELETWTASLTAIEHKDDDVLAVYSKMQLVLKSVLAVTTTLPAYRYARQQDLNSYTIGYRLYTGDRNPKYFGQKAGDVKFGGICMPIGTLHLGVCYRTQMSMEEEEEEVSTTEYCATQYDENYRDGAFVDAKSTPQLDQLIPAAPFRCLFTKSPPSEDGGLPRELTEVRISDDHHVETVCSPKERFEDDFVIVGNPIPFMSTSEYSELSEFYCDWKTAPVLHEDCQQWNANLTSVLCMYESRLEQYDDMVSRLCNSVQFEDLCTV